MVHIVTLILDQPSYILQAKFTRYYKSHNQNFKIHINYVCIYSFWNQHCTHAKHINFNVVSHVNYHDIVISYSMIYNINVLCVDSLFSSKHLVSVLLIGMMISVLKSYILYISWGGHHNWVRWFSIDHVNTPFFFNFCTYVYTITVIDILKLSFIL